jgi:hypothetical protein
MKNTLLVIVLTLIGFNSQAQSKKKQDQEAIKNMCGCFEVTFNFTETFKYSEDENYKPSKQKIAKGLEWGQLVEDENNKISIQHLLIVGPPQKQMVVKHWRQDWLYQNQDFYMFNGDNVWNFETKDKKAIKGQWTQKVYQVDDSPRYEGSGTWIHVDGKSYWENITTAPIPRREYTQRSDYNVTVRGNRHEITEYGWLHDQDNDKVIRKDDNDTKIASEKGYNTYVKVDDSKCKTAQDWWKKQYSKWETVRAKWATVFAKNATLSLKNKVDNKVLFKHLLNDEVTTEEEINKIIDTFVIK